jgi:hypothetical protein
VTPTRPGPSGNTNQIYVIYHAFYVIYHLLSTARGDRVEGRVRFASSPNIATRTADPQRRPGMAGSPGTRPAIVDVVITNRRGRM